MIEIEDSRKKIDEVDQKLLELFEYRMSLAMDVAEYKSSMGKPVYDPVREKEKLESLEALTKNDLNKTAVVDLFSQIIAMSRRLQYGMIDPADNLGFQTVNQVCSDCPGKVVYYGEKGSYTEQAMLEYFSPGVAGISKATFQEVMQAIKEKEADYGVLPIENSSTGALSDIYDLLAKFDNIIIGEHVVKIEHNLWGLPEAKISDISRVYSHPQPLKQCSDFLRRHPGMKQIEGGSTASCARKILEDGDITQAAIASKNAGAYYGLKLLEKSIHNEASNATRFIIISNRKIVQKGAKCTSICFVLPHKSGALYHMLSHFIYNKINMTRIESRPIPGKAFEYRFFVDIEGSIDDPGVKNALYCIKEEALELKILGSYIPVFS
jgi:chorismate mutase/prephenate dehydratase